MCQPHSPWQPEEQGRDIPFQGTFNTEGHFCDLPDTFRPNLLCHHEGLLCCSARALKENVFSSPEIWFWLYFLAPVFYVLFSEWRHYLFLWTSGDLGIDDISRLVLASLLLSSLPQFDYLPSLPPT